jgi:hypothetical protein
VSALSLALLLAAAPPPWCTRAAEIAHAPRDGVADPAFVTRLDEGLALVGATAPQVASVVRGLAGADGGVELAFEALTLAVDDACPAGAPIVDARAAQEQVAGILKNDPRFGGGVRDGDDIVDRIREKIGRWLVTLFESEGMQKYAGNVRVLYFVALLAGIGFIASRVVRALRRSVAVDDDRARAVVEGRRRKAFESWRAEAEAALTAGDARGAFFAGRNALLARLGELDDKLDGKLVGAAAMPARTHREILARVPDDVAIALMPPLRSFDVNVYAREAEVGDARVFLTEVDAAERSLVRGRTT